MEINKFNIDGLIEFRPTIIYDERGQFVETYKESLFKQHGLSEKFVQDNQSISKKGTFRGIHLQTGKSAQGKLVRVVRGEVFDVAVDIRKNSNSYGQWVGVILSSDNKKQLWIPPGFAHGFVVLSDTADFEYKCTDYYDASDEGCLLWNDSEIGINWPIDFDPILSDKDKNGLALGLL